MSHVFNFKSKYSLVIDTDTQFIFDGPDLQRSQFSSTSIDIKLVDEKNKEILLDQHQKDEIIVVLSRIIRF